MKPKRLIDRPAAACVLSALTALLPAAALADTSAHDFSFQASDQLHCVVNGACYAYPKASFSLSLSQPAVAWVNALDADVTGVAPATAVAVQNAHAPIRIYKDVGLQTPIDAVSATASANAAEASIRSFSTQGGITLSTQGDDLTSHAGGGSVTLTHWTVDLHRQRVFADVSASGLADKQTNVPIFDVDRLSGPAELLPAYLAGNPDHAIIDLHGSGLHLTDQAFDLVAQGLRLTHQPGMPATRRIEDWGSFAISAVPEPSNLMLTLAGIAALAAHRPPRRRGRHAPGEAC